ncbi:hypothetical protein ATI61_12247 [Archangium gephyra]|uniref:Lipoprotein n=1 Tax=Archangium gephyra TaxID=48 RepID=A0ABX9JLB3_9BACT|nr:hypothetical protein ATI61_12247 [Archangium gephyra]
MRCGYIPIVLCVLFSSTACPHAFGKGGTIDRAVLKDMEESVRQPKLRDCGPVTLQAICLPEKLAECERQCWEALAAQEEEEW